MKIGFVTSTEDPSLIDDDRLAFPYLEKSGWTVAPVIWDDPSTRLQDYDALIFRSCWNYHRKFPEFLSWLNQLKNLGIPIYNPISTLEWNLNKKHLLELAKSVSVPRTVWLEARPHDQGPILSAVFDAWKVEQLVLKPAVSLNGQNTYLVTREEEPAMEPIAQELLKTRDLLVQEFIPEIRDRGETSLIFFDRQFSHAVIKHPARNDFRVHREYGGTRKSTQASQAGLEFSQKVLSSVKGDLLYARVDFVETSNGPTLIKLEVTDPMLYLHSHETAAENFAKAIEKMMLRRQ